VNFIIRDACFVFLRCRNLRLTFLFSLYFESCSNVCYYIDMKMKLLSPAGDFESLKMAVFYGADEVYLGVKDFNARNNIQGFDIEGLEKAVDFAHIFGVKVHLTVNILFNDDELQSALDLIVAAYNIGVDAFIIQDLGLASLVHKFYPMIEMHASTQMGLHNLEGVKQVEKLGFKRVVLARETPLEEIQRIKKNSLIEIEYFAQGALCVSFSGNCYLSSYLCDASGNRGKCKQLCRLPYSFEKDGKVLKEGFLLSAKDFNLSERLQELEQAGVDAIKIEGRARRPFYVAMATKEYYAALHSNNVMQENLKLAFNRDYTAGYFDGNGSIISNNQNHIGIEIGFVEKVNYGKKFDEIFVRSKRKLGAKSTLKIFDNGKEKCALSAFDVKEIENGLFRITSTQKVAKGDKVNLIVDNALEEKILSKVVKRKVDIHVIAKEHASIKAKVSCGSVEFWIEGEKCLPAERQPLREDEVAKNFEKSEIFDAKTTCELGFVFLQKQKLNEFRRQIFATLEAKIASLYKKSEGLIQVQERCVPVAQSLTDIQIVESLNTSLEAENIIFSPETYKLAEIDEMKKKCHSCGKKLYLDTPNFALKEDIELLKAIISKTGVAIVANNLYALDFDTEIAIGWGLNIFSQHSANFFGKKFLVAEGGVGQMCKAPYMTLRHCPMKANLGASCQNCPYADGFFYRMQNGKKLMLKRKRLSSCTFYLVD